MFRLTCFIDRVNLQPAEINSKAGCPDNGGDSGLCQIQLQNRIGHALRVRFNFPGFRFLRKVETIAGNKSVGLVQHRQGVRIPLRDIIRKIHREAHNTVFERFCPTNQRHPLARKTPEVHCMAATGTAHRDGDMFHAWLKGRGIPLAEDAQPPDEVTPTIASGREVVGAHREINTLSCS